MVSLVGSLHSSFPDTKRASFSLLLELTLSGSDFPLLVPLLLFHQEQWPHIHIEQFRWPRDTYMSPQSVSVTHCSCGATLWGRLLVLHGAPSREALESLFWVDFVKSPLLPRIHILWWSILLGQCIPAFLTQWEPPFPYFWNSLWSGSGFPLLEPVILFNQEQWPHIHTEHFSWPRDT